MAPNHPMACPLANTRRLFARQNSADEDIRVDHLLEQIWICGEEGKPAQSELLRAEGPRWVHLPIVGGEPATRLLARMADSRPSSNSTETRIASRAKREPQLR